MKIVVSEIIKREQGKGTTDFGYEPWCPSSTFLDEPIGGVDPAAREYILNTIINNYSPTSTVLISTHLISDIEPILDEIVFLKDGKVVRQGNVDDIRYESGESIDQLFRQEFKA